MIRSPQLPHIHLVSTHRYPVMARVGTDELKKWLQNAQKIARDVAPFYWTYLETPPDGQIYLTWQPMNRLGDHFASDGYIWPYPDQVMRQDAGGGAVCLTSALADEFGTRLLIFMHGTGARSLL